jgi:hypothetical protein
MYVEYVSNKNEYSGSFYINDPYFKTFYFIIEWVEARKLPHFIFIMLCFKTVVATPSLKVVCYAMDPSRTRNLQRTVNPRRT